jgi:uncharacterized protein YndB with AHSA1/START domain
MTTAFPFMETSLRPGTRQFDRRGASEDRHNLQQNHCASLRKVQHFHCRSKAKEHVMETSTDRIEREISIAATAERVWELIRRPGWWINDGEVVDHTFDPDSDVNVITHPVHGIFRVRTVALDEPRYAAFRWLGDDDGAATTLVEFWIESAASGVTLRVSESGFDSLGVSGEERRKKIEGNTEGWLIELDAALKWALRS